MDAFRTAYVYIRNIFAGELCKKTYTSKTLLPEHLKERFAALIEERMSVFEN